MMGGIHREAVRMTKKITAYKTEEGEIFETWEKLAAFERRRAFLKNHGGVSRRARRSILHRGKGSVGPHSNPPRKALGDTKQMAGRGAGRYKIGE